MGRAIIDGGVDDGALPGPLRIDQTRQQARHQIQRAAADVADQCGGGLGRRVGC